MEIMTFSATAVLPGWALVQKLAFLCVKIFLHSEKMPFLHHVSCIQRAIASLSSQDYLLLWLDICFCPCMAFKEKNIAVCFTIAQVFILMFPALPICFQLSSIWSFLCSYLCTQQVLWLALCFSFTLESDLVFSVFSEFSMSHFQFAFFSLCPPSPTGWLQWGGGTSPRAEYRNFGDLRTDG